MKFWTQVINAVSLHGWCLVIAVQWLLFICFLRKGADSPHGEALSLGTHLFFLDAWWVPIGLDLPWELRILGNEQFCVRGRALGLSGQV